MRHRAGGPTRCQKGLPGVPGLCSVCTKCSVQCGRAQAGPICGRRTTVTAAAAMPANERLVIDHRTVHITSAANSRQNLYDPKVTVHRSTSHLLARQCEAPRVRDITMLSRSSCRQLAARTVRGQWQTNRGLASPASGSFSYDTGIAAGIKYAARDMPGATTQLALVARAGTRFESAPGMTLGLEGFAFKVMTNQRTTYPHSC